MRRIATLISILTLVAMTGLTDQTESSSRKVNVKQIHLLNTGQFHGDEVTALTGEQWLGLYVNGNESYLAPSVLTVGKVHDEVVDEDTSAATGTEVRVDSSPLEPVFLVRGAPTLKSGRVTTSFNGEEAIPENFDRLLEFSGFKYHLKVTSKKAKDPEEPMPPDAQLILTDGKTSQILYDLSRYGQNEPGWKLLWAGDLDGDGKLDLYVDVSRHYNVSERRLFLSSEAVEGELVKEIAVFRTVGC